ncbi:hypothetical protein GCM10023334_055870 [Nonomuraea thailandensis]
MSGGTDWDLTERRVAGRPASSLWAGMMTVTVKGGDVRVSGGGGVRVSGGEEGVVTCVASSA